jgi:hypothetical protein
VRVCSSRLFSKRSNLEAQITHDRFVGAVDEVLAPLCKDCRTSKQPADPLGEEEIFMVRRAGASKILLDWAEKASVLAVASLPVPLLQKVFKSSHISKDSEFSLESGLSFTAWLSFCLKPR